MIDFQLLLPHTTALSLLVYSAIHYITLCVCVCLSVKKALASFSNPTSLLVSSVAKQKNDLFVSSSLLPRMPHVHVVARDPERERGRPVE